MKYYNTNILRTIIFLLYSLFHLNNFNLIINFILLIKINNLTNINKIIKIK